MKFRKKPVVIEATQWFKSGDHPEDNRETFISTGHADLPKGTPFLGEGKIVRYYRHPEIPGTSPCISTMSCGHTMHDHGWIDTPEGGHNVCPGDWIIKGVKGEFYPVKPDIFEMTYEPVVIEAGE